MMDPPIGENIVTPQENARAQVLSLGQEEGMCPPNARSASEFKSFKGLLKRSSSRGFFSKHQRREGSSSRKFAVLKMISLTRFADHL